MSTLGWGAHAAHAAVIADSGVHQLTETSCSHPANGFVPQPAAQPVQLAAQASKSAAILGGQPSALELIRMSQEDAGTPAPAEASLAVAAPTPAQPLSPAIGGFRFRAAECLGEPVLPQARPLGSDDFLASKRLAIGRTSFDRDWQRVSGDRISASRYRKLLGGAANDELSALRSVNSWVNRAIAFTEDRDLYSRADFWAGAAMTLKLRRGDCEDIALTKMQLLAAAGIPREDMVLTIARDLVRNADHAVLIVRHEGRYYLLDNASDELLDASLSHDYRPILSFGSSQTWLHGY